MGRIETRVESRRWFWGAAMTSVLAACGGGGTGNERDSGAGKTTLRVEASDADGDALSYQWRVTAGSVDNRNARETVWTLPTGPGLHFAYVIVSDGKGGYAEQQYAVSSDALDTAAPVRIPINRAAPTFTGFDGGSGRLRLAMADRMFMPEGGGAAVKRTLYLPSVRVELRSGTNVVFAGETDESGELLLPQLQPGVSLGIHCGTSRSDALLPCGTFAPQASGALTQQLFLAQNTLPAGSNLRLFGHLALADGSVCGMRNEFAGVRSTQSVQVLDASGAALTPQVQINRFGDYAIDAPVLVDAALTLRVRCDTLTHDVPIAAAGGFTGAAVELSAALPNTRPRIQKVVANGPDGNVRGRMVVAEAGVSSNGLPGPDHFLAFKGKDTRRGACEYYKSFGAVADCDAQGNMTDPITLDDWKRQHQLAPYLGSNSEVKATYINKMDLNLVRRMTATKSAPNNIAFYVCNNPGPEGTSQREVDEVIATALGGEREVACVAMEWSVTPGANGNQPFTKFLTFGPDGSLLLSVNLDGRGEKFLPGTCVACHGGTHYAGKFPDAQGASPSPFLGSAFLTFDTGNYFLSSANGLRKADQQAAFKALNALVVETEQYNLGSNAIRNLYEGWYAGGTSGTLDENYVPSAWLDIELGRNGQTQRAGAARLYREVVGSSCRTCHAAFKGFDWDANPGSIVVNGNAGERRDHVCGGSPDLIVNASMPNALISRDRALQRVTSDPSLAALMQEFFGCTTPLPDPAHARR
jgi:hypothetical protein